jgi:hypothetical protein
MDFTAANKPADPASVLANRLATLFSELPQVIAVALGGSAASGAADATSDIDLYVYVTDAIPVSARRAIVERAGGASRADMDLPYWGGGDEWIDAATGIEVDAMTFGTEWMAEQVRRVLVDHTPSLGYTTAFWHTVRVSRPLHDPTGWLAALQAEAAAPYPEALRRAIVAHNRPILRDIIPSFRAQIVKGVERGDLVSINHRLAKLLASYFDILFAVNRVPHPGEKRLLARAAALCPSLPRDMAADVAAALVAAGAAPGELPGHLDRLLDRLDEWLAQEMEG